MLCLSVVVMNTIKYILCLLILTVNCTCYEDFSEDDIPTTNITCYRCNNRHIDKPKCDKAPAKGVEGGEVKEVISVQEEHCMTVNEFLAEHDLITQKWMNMNFRKGRGRSRSNDVQSGRTTDTLQAYCATIVIFTEEYQAIPHVYRDCIKGYPGRIQSNFVNNFEYNGTKDFEMPKKGRKKCNRKTMGFHRVNVCLCQSDKCNGDNALAKMSGCNNVKMKSAIYSFVSSFIFISLLNSYLTLNE